MISIVVFFIGSLIGALAINIDMLIAGRVIQGTGGGGILGLSATVIGDVFSPRYARPRLQFSRRILTIAVNEANTTVCSA